jgi:hypothetical protein
MRFPKNFPFDRIDLPNDADLVARLRAKLEEYKGRDRYTAPEMNQDLFFKIKVLEHLLEAGNVTLDWCIDEFTQLIDHGVYQDHHLFNALTVVNAYCEEDLGSLRNSTGLPQVAAHA